MSTSATFGLIFLWAEMVNVLGKICGFFGHRDVKYTKELENLLKQEVEKLIEEGYDEFWVCNEGSFDWISRMVMRDIKEEYHNTIYVCYISAYDPDKFSKIRLKYLQERYELDYPLEVFRGHPKYAIIRRNNYIADNADAIICYIEHKNGGAYQAVQRAIKNEKVIINLAD
ncbi:MAG: hypothetical protein IJW75_00255 [Alphaproteobacteria bacterium]|nr:hypothetical protein [Alphaproteobacteria bacterium]